MKIGLIDVDSSNFPNIPLMKLSAYHKAQGDDVEWYSVFSGQYDRVYMSKVFDARWCNNRIIFAKCPDFKDYNHKLG